MVATLGVAHASGTYHIGAGTFMQDGVDFINDTIGCNTVELWLSPSYATQYPDVWGGVPANLTQLAGFNPLAIALADAGVHTYVLKCFSWNDAQLDSWKFTTLANRTAYYAAEYTEIYNLATYLLTTYAGTGKRFILQTSETDWALLDGVATTYVNPERLIWCAGWMRTRQNAIEQARRDTPASDVYVEGAIELNRTFECLTNYDEPRIVTKVLDKIKPDRVSFSAYQVITDPAGPPWWYTDEAAMVNAVETNLRSSFELIRRYTDAPIYIGEAGYPEAEVPAGYDVKVLIENMIGTCDDEGATHFIYWQIFCNELTGAPPTNRGYWLIDNLGNQTDSGDQIQAMQVGRP